MSLDRIHVYELSAPSESDGAGQTYAARVVDAGGPVAVGTDVTIVVAGEDDVGGPDALNDLVKAHGLARGIDVAGVASPLDFGLLGSGHERRLWTAMPIVEGRTLAGLLADVEYLPDPLAEAMAVVLAEACVATQAVGLHGIALDPARIIVRADSSVVIVGAALAALYLHHARQADAGAPERICVAPELLADPSQQAHASDLFSLGAVLYHCVAGVPFDAHMARLRDDGDSRRPNDVRYEASIFLSEVVHDLLEPEAEMRMASAEGLVGLLEERRESPWWQARNIGQDSVDFTDDTESEDVAEPELPPIPAPAPPPTQEWYDERRKHAHGFAEHAAPCVARDAELALLLERVRDLREEGGAIVLVEGDAGVGKTRLLDELLRRAIELPGLVVLYGEHRPRGIGRPMQAFTEALTRWIAGDRRDVTSEDVRPLLGDATAIAPAFAAFMSSAPLPPGEKWLTREALASAFLQSLRTLSREGPVLFVVENLQWADPEGLDLFGHLARTCEMLPLLLVGSHRPTPPRSPLHALGAALSVMRRYRSMPLAQLGRVGARDVARALVKPDATADALVSALAPEIVGLPEALVEASATLAAAGQLTGGPSGPWEAAEGFDLAALAPDFFGTSLEDLLERRLAPLSTEDRGMLQMASVQGLVFDGDVTRRALEIDESAGRSRFQSLEERGFLRGEHPVWRFPSNDLFQSVHDGLSDDDLVDCHRATADAFLASRNPDQLPPSEIHGILNYRVAWHYLLAGQNARGLLYMPAAIIHLRDTWRIGDAERLSNLASRALVGDAARAGDLVGLLLERGELLGLQGRRVEQREVISEALLRAREHGDPTTEARVILESARLRVVTGQLERARDEGREAMRIASDEEDARLESNCQQLLGTVAFREGRYQQARTHMQAVLELSRNIRDEEAEAEALQTLGTISQDVGSWLHAEELQRQAMAIHRRAGDLASEAEVLTSLGIIAAANDDPVRGEQYLRRAVAIHRARGDGYGEARVLGQLGLLMHDSWRLAEARAMHAESCRASREVGARQEELAALINLATVEFLLGAFDDSRDHYGDALRAAREIGDLRLEGYSLTGLGEVGRQCGELTIAEGLIERAVQKLDSCDDPGGLAAALLAQGRIALLRGDDELSLSLLDRSQALARGAATPTVTALSLSLLGLLAARSSDADLSSARFAAAREQLDKLGAPGDSTLVEVVFFESLALRVRRDPGRADRLLSEARTLLDTMAERLPPDDRERYLTSGSPAREIMAGTAGTAGKAPAPTTSKVD